MPRNRADVVCSAGQRCNKLYIFGGCRGIGGHAPSWLKTTPSQPPKYSRNRVPSPQWGPRSVVAVDVLVVLKLYYESRTSGFSFILRFYLPPLEAAFLGKFKIQLLTEFKNKGRTGWVNDRTKKQFRKVM